MGLTHIKLLTYYWVSQLGMLFGTVVYVNAGTQLARIDKLSDVASPGLLASLALLGVFPLLAKQAWPCSRHANTRAAGRSRPALIATWWSSAQVRRGWSRPTSPQR